MSGTSLDGLDLACVTFFEENAKWQFEIIASETLPFETKWQNRLSNLATQSALTWVQTDHDLGKYFGICTKKFIEKHKLNPCLIASHGQTIFHQPQLGFTAQIGHGAQIAAQNALPIICDFRTLDVALGGQGAPLVPIGDELLFSQYDFCLNLGGIANVSFQNKNQRLAYDICPFNLIFNDLANQLNLPYDESGKIASQGTIDKELLLKLNSLDFYKQNAPKSLGREWINKNLSYLLNQSQLSIPDLMRTCSEHIATQIANSLLSNCEKEKNKLLITGGGAYNLFLISLLETKIGNKISVIIPDKTLIEFKEAVIFAFLGLLRYLEKPNVLASVTGSTKNHIGACIYLG